MNDFSVNRLQPADIEIVAALGDSVIGSTGKQSHVWTPWQVQVCCKVLNFLELPYDELE